MIQMKFNGKKRATNKSFVVTIPKALAVMLENKEYTFTITEKEATQ